MPTIKKGRRGLRRKMDRDKWLLLFSILIFVGLGLYYLPSGWLWRSTQKGGTSGVAARPAAPQPVPRGRASAGSAETSRQGEVIDEHTPWGRNPFLTEEETKGRVADELRIKTIIVGPPKSVAVVNGHTVQVGEKIAEETVVEIRPDAVILERDGRRRILRLSEPSVSIDIKDGKR